MDRLTAFAIVSVIAFGTVLRIWQYSAGNALWLDEIAIARNVLERSSTELLSQPLAYQQTAPKGVLAAVKASSVIGGASEYALRAWPFMASLAALIMFPLLAAKVLGPSGMLAAVTAFAFAVPIIRQTAQVKQYSTDVACSPGCRRHPS